MPSPSPEEQPNETASSSPPPPKTSSAPPPSSPPPPPSDNSPPPSKSPSPKSSPPPKSPPPSPPKAPPPKASSPPPPPPSPPPSATKDTPSPPPPSSSSPSKDTSPPPPPSSPPPSPPSPPSSSGTPPAPPNSPPPPESKPPEKSPSTPSGKSPPKSTASPPTSDESQTDTPPSPQSSGPTSPSPPGTPLVPPPPVNASSPASPTQLNSSTGGNPLISKPTSPQNVPIQSQSSGNAGLSIKSIVAISVVSSAVLIGLIGLVILLLKRHKKKVAKYDGGYATPSPYRSCGTSEGMSSPSEPGGLGYSKAWFTYQELEEITDGFASQNLLGEGGFGAVYKGHLADGREVAVKQLNIKGAQGEREFKAEVEIISRVHHRHLVSLVGYCISDSQRLLVYHYVPNNNLYYHLHGEGRPVMDWTTRSRVAAGSARGIAYLHEDCHPRIIHRDIKSSNILLDDNFEALVSDFGLAKLALDSNTHVTTRVMGTFGYMAPEYATSGKLTDKSDVFSFGVVLLELITGRKPVDTSRPLGEESLVEWARPLLLQALETEEPEGLVDPALEKNYEKEEVLRMIEAAAACVRHSSTKRPRMGQVMRSLDSLGYSPDLRNGMTPGESGIYNDADQSAEIKFFRRMAFGSQDYSTEVYSQNSG